MATLIRTTDGAVLVRRQGVGYARAVRVEDLVPGQGLVWNWSAGEYEVVSVRRVSAATCELTERHLKTGRVSARRKRVGSLVGVAD